MQKFDTPTPISAVLDIPAGSIRLVASDRPDTVVEILPMDASRVRDARLAEQTRVEYADGTLRVEAPGKNRLGHPGSVEVTVQLPTESQVESRAASAEFRGVGRFGSIVVEGAHGAIEIDSAASVRVTIANGDVLVGHLDGPAEISTAKGDIRISEAVRGTVKLATQMGDVSVGAAHGVSAALDAGTTLGRIQNALKNTDGAAELNIRATTTSGDIDARSL